MTNTPMTVPPNTTAPDRSVRVTPASVALAAATVSTLAFALGYTYSEHSRPTVVLTYGTNQTPIAWE